MREPEEAREALDMIREIGGDDLVQTLLKTFVEYADAQLARATEAAAVQDAPAIARVAHALKASARQLGAMGFADACAAAEVAGAGSRDVGAAVAGVEAMQREYDLAAPWLRSLAASE